MDTNIWKTLGLVIFGITAGVGGEAMFDFSWWEPKFLRGLSLVVISIIGISAIYISEWRKQRLLKFSEAIEKSQVAWGLWHTGVAVKAII